MNEARKILKPVKLSKIIVICGSPAVRSDERELVHPLEDLSASVFLGGFNIGTPPSPG